MSGGRWIGLTALLLGGAAFAFIALRTDLLQSVSREEVQARLDERLQELEEALGVADRDRAAFARIDRAAKSAGAFSDRAEEDGALDALYSGLRAAEASEDAYRELASQPEVLEAVERLLAGDGASDASGGEPQPGDGLELRRLDLSELIGVAMFAASLDGDALRCAALARVQFAGAATLLRGSSHTEWIMGHLWMQNGLGALGAPTPPDLLEEEESAFQLDRALATGARLAELLDGAERARVATAVRRALAAFPSNERTVLIGERSSLQMLWPYAEAEGGGARVVRRMLDGMEEVRNEQLAMAACPTLEEMQRRADELDMRLREAGNSWLGFAAGDPLSYASLIAPRPPTASERLRAESTALADAFLGALER